MAHDYSYEVQRVPLALGSSANMPADMNNAGQVVGTTFIGPNAYGFLWQDGGEVVVLTGPTGEGAQATGINNGGLTVGFYVGATGYRPCRWVAGSTFAVDLGLPSQATSGIPVGVSDDGTVYGNLIVMGRERPFRWTDASGTVELPSIPFLDFSLLSGVGRGGQGLCVGTRRDTQLGSPGPFYYDGDEQHLLPSPPGMDALVPRAMNLMGETAGSARVANEWTSCLWHEDGGLHFLETPTGYAGALARDLNSEGVIVGETGGPVVGWVSGHHGILNLSLLPLPGASADPVPPAVAINDEGAILAGNPHFAIVLLPKIAEWTEGHIALQTLGSMSSGDETGLRVVDSEVTTFEGGLASFRSGPRIDFQLEGTSTFSNPNRLVFRTVARQASAGQAWIEIQLWDWIAGRYSPVDRVESRLPVPALGLLDLVATGDLSRYMEPGTRRMRAHIRVRKTSGAQPLSVEFDQLSWHAG